VNIYETGHVNLFETLKGGLGIWTYVAVPIGRSAKWLALCVRFRKAQVYIFNLEVSWASAGRFASV
jgi:hypothetical protein